MTSTGQNHNKNIVQTSHHESSGASEKTTAASVPLPNITLTMEQFYALVSPTTTLTMEQLYALIQEVKRGGREEKRIQSTCRKRTARGMIDARVQTSPARRTKTCTRQASSSRAALDMEKKGTRDEESLPTFMKRCPFSKDLMTEFLKYDFCIPPLPTFEGKGNAHEHVSSFESIMILYNMSDGLNCRMFITTLRGRALAWFTQLEIGSISSYQQLIKQFLTHFGWSSRGAWNARMYG